MNTALLIAAAIVSVLLFFGLIGLIKTTVKTALMIAVVVFLLQYFTGIGPQQVFQQVLQMLGGVGNWLQRWGGTYKPPSDFKDKQSAIEMLNLVASYVQNLAFGD